MIAVSAVLVLSCGQTDTQTDADERLTPATLIGVSKELTACSAEQQRQRNMRQFHTISLSHILASPGYATGTIAVNVTWMKKRIQCLSNALQHVPNPSIFNCLLVIVRYWSEIAIFPTPLHLMPQLGCSHWNSGKSLVLRNIESWGYQAVKTV